MITTSRERFSKKFWKYFAEYMKPLINKNTKIIDFGAGTGSFIKGYVERFPYSEIHAVEIMDYMLDELKKLKIKNLFIDVMDLHNPEPINKTFDIAILSFIIHELIEPVSMLKFLKKILKPGGRAIILDWIRMPLKKYMEIDYTENVVFSNLEEEKRFKLFKHFMEHNKYTESDLIYLLKKTGFKILDIRKYDSGKHIKAVIEPAK